MRVNNTALKLGWGFSKLETVDNGSDGVDLTYEYDALGRRVRVVPAVGTGMVYVHGGSQILAEFTDGASPMQPEAVTVYGDYVDEPIWRRDGSEAQYYHRNQQFSIVAVTDDSGNVIERYSYDLYGKTTFSSPAGVANAASTIGNSYTFTGRRVDGESGLLDFRSRVYSADLGRFLQRDHLGFVDGMNLYHPYFAPRLVDPYGGKAIEPPGSRSARWFICKCGAPNGDGRQSRLMANGFGNARVRCKERCGGDCDEVFIRKFWSPGACCEQRKEKMKGEAGAEVVCNEGKPVICVYVTAADRGIKGEVGNAIDDCQLLHEKYHYRRHVARCDPRYACNSGAELVPGMNIGLAECEANSVHVHCLQKKMRECHRRGDLDCMKTLTAEIRLRVRVVNSHGYCKGLAFPMPIGGLEPIPW
jgi:RHS repeat-associated protein